MHYINPNWDDPWLSLYVILDVSEKVHHFCCWKGHPETHPFLSGGCSNVNHVVYDYPLVMTNIAIENGHRNIAIENGHL